MEQEVQRACTMMCLTKEPEDSPDSSMNRTKGLTLSLLPGITIDWPEKERAKPPSRANKLWSTLRGSRATSSEPSKATIIKNFNVDVAEIVGEINAEVLSEERAAFRKRIEGIWMVQEESDRFEGDPFEECQGHQGGLRGLWNVRRG